MGSLRFVFVLSLILVISLGFTTAQICYSTGNFTSNSSYGKNRNLILSSLPGNVTAANGGFYTATMGQDSDKVYALALCRGDKITSESCFSCINSSIHRIINNCPNQKEALAVGGCIVRCSNRDIFGRMELSPPYLYYNTGNITSDLDKFDQIWTSFMNDLVSKAAMGSSNRLLKYASGEEKLTDFQRIYAFVQCTPDLSESDCRACLQTSMDDYQGCCHGKRGGGVGRPSCFLRFDLYPFLESTAEAPPPLPPPPVADYSPPPPPRTTTTTEGNRSSISRTTVVIIGVPTIIILTLVILTCVYFLMIKPKKKDVKASVPDEETIKEVDSLQFDLRIIRAATDDFSDANKIGQGGFGSVYKGRLSDGQEIAVKRLANCTAKGEVDFKNEIVLMARLQHRNIARFLGFCLGPNERILIFEFVPNTSLDRFIFDPIKGLLLDWEKRYKIIGGIARGILYLHEDSQLRIIHRDLKASNILLDNDMNPKIADFGTAKLFLLDQSQGNTRRIVGTYGCMAPEYAKHGQISVKTDVFSFGVLMLEIVSGKKNGFVRNPGNVDHLPSYAWKLWRKGTAFDLIDPTLRGSSRSEIIRCIHIGLLCVQESVANRPTMASVVLMLASHSTSLPSPSQPAFFMDPDTTLQEYTDTSGVPTDSDQPSNTTLPPHFSVNEASISDLYPR